MKTVKHAYSIATISGVHYGLRDFPDEQPGLWFGADWDGGSCTFFAMQNQEANKFLADNHILDINDLNGRYCVIDAPGAGACIVKFVCLLEE